MSSVIGSTKMVRHTDDETQGQMQIHLYATDPIFGCTNLEEKKLHFKSI